MNKSHLRFIKYCTYFEADVRLVGVEVFFEQTALDECHINSCTSYKYFVLI